MPPKTINAKFVDFNGKKYRPGEEDELAKVLPRRDIEVLTERGILKGDWDDAGDLPAVRELPEHLAGIETVEDVRLLQARDDRKSAAPIYDNRIAEIEAQG